MALVTLLTDFGTRDGYPGAMKGVIFTRAPGARVVDLSHDVPRHDVIAGAFALGTAAPWFPAGTIFVAVVDPGVGGSRHPVVTRYQDHVFIGPDNGLLTRAVPQPHPAHIIEDAAFVNSSVSNTFHGRDVFAAAAGHIAAGADPSAAGPAIDRLLPLPRTEGVVHIDCFGNLITDLDPSRLPQRPRFSIGGATIDGLSTAFESARPGELLAYMGSQGTVEIAVREGSAAERLGVDRGAPIAVESLDHER